jgi:hypothetical protein
LNRIHIVVVDYSEDVNEMKYHIDIQDIVFVNVLFPLPVVKSFFKIVHLLCTLTAFFHYLTSFCIMSFADPTYSDAKNSINTAKDSHQETISEVVMCFGTFDIFHPGHAYYLSKAQKLAKKMIVVIARDHRVISGK